MLRPYSLAIVPRGWHPHHGLHVCAPSSPPGLRAGNHLARLRVARFRDELRDLRCLAGPGLANQDGCLMLVDHVHKVGPGLPHWQPCATPNNHRETSPRALLHVHWHAHYASNIRLTTPTHHEVMVSASSCVSLTLAFCQDVIVLLAVRSSRVRVDGSYAILPWWLALEDI